MLERMLVSHCAPTLAHLKPGSLFVLAYESERWLERQLLEQNALLRSKGLELTVLRQSNGRALLYLYRATQIGARLQAAETQAFLAGCGYAEFSVPGALRQLRRRLAMQEDFPHEIGVFLGYPLSDVIGFICNGGQNCLLAGYWKVYSDECAARRTFERFRKCYKVYMRRFQEGYPLSRLAVATRSA